jgi:hypothetical protein
MGCFGSKDRLSKEDLDFLKTHTRYDETTIKEWYKGFKVDTQLLNQHFRKNISLRLSSDLIMKESTFTFKSLGLLKSECTFLH